MIVLSIFLLKEPESSGAHSDFDHATGIAIGVENYIRFEVEVCL